MAHLTSLRRLSRQEWDSSVLSFRDLSYHQCASYSEAAARDVGAVPEFMGIYQGDRLIGLACVRIKTIPHAGLGIAYVNGGPLTLRGNDFSPAPFFRCIVALEKEYVSRRKLVLRVVLPNAGLQRLAEQSDCLDELGFQSFGQNKRKETVIVDLGASLENIRKNFNGKWRNRLSRAERSNVHVTKSTAVSDFDLFEPLFLNLARQKKFSTPQDVTFFRRVQEDTPAAQQLVMHLAWEGNELIAGHLGSFIGDTAIYLLGAANVKGRKLQASYLLQWAVIQYARSVGNRRYDLGGINEEENPGCYHFKDRMGGRHVREIQYELAPGPFRASIVHFMEGAYNATARRLHQH